MTSMDDGKAAEKPGHVVLEAFLWEHPEIPQVKFVWPLHPESHGMATNARGYAIPMVIVTGVVTSEELIRAAERLGGGIGLTQSLRAAVKAWLRGEAAQAWPTRQPGETRDEAVLRVRARGAELAENRRLRQSAELLARVERDDEARLAAMAPSEREHCEREHEIIDRHTRAMRAELDTLKASRRQEQQA